MPTLIDIDSFQHQVLRIGGPWYTITDESTIPCHDGVGIVFDETQPRTADHACSLKYSGHTTNIRQVRRLVTGTGNVAVASFYFRCVTAPTSDGFMFRFIASTNAFIKITSTGAILSSIQGGTAQTSASTYADGNWHRIDCYYNMTTTSGTFDVKVDGTSNTQATGTVTVANITAWEIGTNAAQAAAFDMWISDMVISSTSGDYPIGDHICKLLAINGSGTDSPGVGAFQNESGGAETSASVDDAWDGTTPNLTQTGEDYTQQTANDAAGYVEYTVADPASGDTTIWGVELVSLMAAEDSATACNGETRLVDSGGTTMATTGLVDPSVNLSYYTGYRICATTSPGGDGWTNSELGGVLIRFGFSTDAAPDVAFNAGAVEYAAAWSPPAAVTMPPKPTIALDAAHRSFSW